MNDFVGELNRKRLFFFSLAFLMIIVVVFLILFGESITFLALNSFHKNWLNNFFIYYTLLGDGIFSILVSIFFIFRNRRLGIALLLAFLSSGLIAQIVKACVVSPRPKAFFKANLHSFFIDGVTLHNSASFPSGHTTSAFAMATVLVVFFKNKKMQLPLLLAAVLVGYSRIYLSQHFLGDVLAGSFIGVVFGILMSWIVMKSKYSFFNTNKLK